MSLCIDPLECVLDAKLLVSVLELLAAHQRPLTGLAFTADVMHTVVIEDDLHITAAIDDLVRLIERLGESSALELDCIIESLNHCVPFLVVDKIILPDNYLKHIAIFK
nr:MAG TPA: hypothetical protein [Caudoviricetes sp.]